MNAIQTSFEEILAVHVKKDTELMLLRAQVAALTESNRQMQANLATLDAEVGRLRAKYEPEECSAAPCEGKRKRR